MLVAVYIFNSPAIPLYNKNISVGIIATGEKNEKSLANNVTLSQIIVNGKEVNLGKLEYIAEEPWTYDSQNDFLCCIQCG